jgi:hypothetical protein
MLTTKLRSDLTEDEKKKKKRVLRKSQENYVDGNEMLEEIREFYKTDVFTDKLADMMQKIAYKLASAANFYRYSYKDQMIGDALIKMIQVLKKKNFDPDRGFSPFWYFTQVAYRAFLTRIKSEKNRHENQLKYQEMVYQNLHEDGYVPAKKNTKNVDCSSIGGNMFYTEE